jgi:hypothetical protein
VRATALVACLALAAVALAACGGEKDRFANVTFAPGPTPAPVEPTLDSFSFFVAGDITTALGWPDAAFFQQRAITGSLTCPDETQPRCENSVDGAQIGGFWVGPWRSEGTLVTPEDYLNNLTDYLNSLTEPVVYAIAERETSLRGEGGPAFYAVITDAAAPTQAVRVFEFVIEEGSWRSPIQIDAGPLAEEWTSGECEDCYTTWRLWEPAS